MPPRLAQTSKKIRTEIMPIFYGENSFDINIDIDVIDFEDDMYPVRRAKDNSKLDEFLEMLSCIIATGGLKYITSLSMTYSEPVFEDMSNYLFGFDLIGNSSGHNSSGPRVGNNNPDWDNRAAVTKAFNTAFKRISSVDPNDLKRHVPVSNILKVLLTVAKHCELANKYVKLTYDYGH